MTKRVKATPSNAPSEQPLVPAFTVADVAMAKRRLTSWVPQVDPMDRAHIDAFLCAKMQSSRVSLQAVLAIIKEQKLGVERSSSQDAVFFVAPRSNFPKGLSTEQQKWLVTKDELLARYEVHDDNTDFDTVFVFSDACPRATLGKFVHQLKLSLKLARTTRGPQTAANTEAASRTASSNDGLELDVDLPPPSKKPR